MKTPEKSMPTRKEHRFMVNLMVVLHTLRTDREAAEARLAAYGYRYVRRDVGLLIRLVDKLQEAMLESMPDRRIGYYRRIAQEAQMVVDFPGPVPRTNSLLIDTNDLAAITEAAMTHECAMCIRSGREVKNCRLREALLPVAPPTEFSRTGCEYRQPASQLVQGEDITI